MATGFWNVFQHWRDPFAWVFTPRIKPDQEPTDEDETADIELKPTRLEKIGTMKVKFRPGPGLRTAPVDPDDACQ